MVHGLAAQSGGTLRIRSNPGQGTTIELWLPEAEGVVVPAVAAPLLVPKVIHPRRVLLVDDDPLVLSGTAAMLDDLGHEVVATASGQEALAVLRSGGAVDLVVTDQMMPGMTGLELAAEIERLHPGMTVLLASGFAELSDAEAARLPRLRKPFTQAELAQAIAGEDARRGVPNGVVPLRRQARA